MNSMTNYLGTVKGFRYHLRQKVAVVTTEFKQNSKKRGVDFIKVPICDGYIYLDDRICAVPNDLVVNAGDRVLVKIDSSANEVIKRFALSNPSNCYSPSRQ